MLDGKHARLDLLIRVISSSIALRQSGQGECQGKQVQEFLVISLDVVRFSHSAGSLCGVNKCTIGRDSSAKIGRLTLSSHGNGGAASVLVASAPGSRGGRL